MALSKQESALYDRQIRLWGVAAQQRMRESKILIVGMTALAAELCKNIVLAGLNVVILDGKSYLFLPEFHARVYTPLFGHFFHARRHDYNLVHMCRRSCGTASRRRSTSVPSHD